MGLKVYISLLFIILFLFNSVSQEPIINIEGNVITEKDDSIEGVTVKIYQGLFLIAKYKTDSSGVYPKTTIKYNRKYRVIVKKKGFTTKKISIDAKTYYKREDVEQEVVVPMTFRLLKKKMGVNYSIIEKKPVARIHIDNATGLIDYDFMYIKKRKEEIDQFLAKYHN